MTRTPFIAALLLATACSSPDGAETTPPDAAGPQTAFAGPADEDERAADATVQRLFDALETGDEALLRSVVAPGVVMHFAEIRDGSSSFGSSTLDQLAARITTSEVRLVERMWDPVVAIDGPMATVWTPYDFYAGDAFSHCGVDVATLMRGDEGWRIVALSWTRQQPPACDLHPDGPPNA